MQQLNHASSNLKEQPQHVVIHQQHQQLQELRNIRDLKNTPSHLNHPHPDSSSDSDNSNQGRSSFVRADVHTTRNTYQEHGSVVLGSISASSLPSSVASSHEFDGHMTRLELFNSPIHSNVLESGIHLR